MAISTTAAPSEIRDALIIGLNDLHLSDLARNPLSWAPETFSAPLLMSKPLQVFSLGFNDLFDRNFLGRARLTGWRYLLVGSGHTESGTQSPRAVVDIHCSAERGIRFGGLRHGLTAAALLAAAQIVGQAAKQLSGNYMVAMLDIPAIHLSALWLRGSGEHSDVFALLHPRLGAADPSPNFVDQVLQRVQERVAGGVSPPNAPEHHGVQ